MGQSVQLLVVTLRPGSERGAGAGDVARAAGRAGDAVDGKGCPGPPAAPVGGRGCEEGGRQGWGVRAQLRVPHWSSPHTKVGCGRGVGVPRELHRGAGGWHGAGPGKHSYVPSCSRKGLKGVTGVRWFSHLLVLQRTKIPQRLLHPTPIQR